jgi:glutamine synthetase
MTAGTFLQHECFMLGIPLRTRHREVAPNQYEFAPMFGIATTQIDQNLTVMQVRAENIREQHAPSSHFLFASLGEVWAF